MVERILTALGVLVVAGIVIFVTFVWYWSIAPLKEVPTDFDRSLVLAGAQLAAVGDCGTCHAGRNGQPYAGGQPVHTPFGVVYASNITADAETGIGLWSEAAFRRAMRYGVDRRGNFLYPAFPYNHYTHVGDSDVKALYAFLMTRQPVSAKPPETRLSFPLDIRSLIAGWNILFLDHRPLQPMPEMGILWNRGLYLVEGLGHCRACHTPHNSLGGEMPSRAFMGGLADGWEGPGLTFQSSPAAVTWTGEALYRYLRHGHDAQHEAAAGPMSEVSHNLSTASDDDVRAIATYIASLIGAPDPAHDQQALSLAAAAQTPPESLAGSDGAVIFAGACAGCHGLGAPRMASGQPSLSLASSVTGPTPRNATQVTLYGLQPRDGERGPWMPGFADTLTNAQIASVLTYMRARFAVGPAWSAVEQGVEALRKDRHS